MARKDQKNKKSEVPVGGNISEELTEEDIAEREAEALKDAGIEPATECPEDDEAEEPVAKDAGEQTPTAEDQPTRKGLFGGTRGIQQPSQDRIDDGPDLPDESVSDDIFDDYSIEEEMIEAEKSETEYERDNALPAIIEFAKKHSEIARKNNWGGIASAFNSLAAVAQQTQQNSQKKYWTKREKV